MKHWAPGRSRCLSSAGEIDTFDAFVSAFQGALTELGADKFDYLVNNAGNASGMGFLNATEAEFDALYRIHVKSVFFLSQKLLPLLADGGRIVNVSSGLTRIVMANRAPYAIMKSAVETLTRYMAFELGSRGITVNCVAPGAIATDFSGGVVRDNPQVAQAVANMTALGRPGLPEDIGPMIASLLSDDHRWVNAQRIEDVRWNAHLSEENRGCFSSVVNRYVSGCRYSATLCRDKEIKICRIAR